ncbi:MAG: DMT family transporter [Bdellovibrionales bacterium]|nr:DMT family transporter [Bdellovibrionales bacterium]
MGSASRSHPPRSVLIFGALIGIQLLFGSGYVVSKVMVGAFPPMVWASLRITISAILMLSIALASGRPSPRGWKTFFKPLIGLSLLGVVINQSSFLVGLKFTTPTNSAILNTLIPIFTLLLVILRRVESMSWQRMIGFMLALCGVLSIRHIEDFHFANQTVIGDLLTILNCLSFACFLVFGKTFMEKHDNVWTTAWLFIYGSVGITALAIPDYLHFQMPQMTATLWFCAAFAVLGTTLLTYFLNFWALANVRSSSVALYIYLQPVVASAVSYIFLSEQVTLRTVLSAGLIFLGMIFGRAKESLRS